MAKALPPLSAIAGAVLRTASGDEVRAATLWATTPVLFFALRRPGCILCRDTAKKVRCAALRQLTLQGGKGRPRGPLRSGAALPRRSRPQAGRGGPAKKLTAAPLDAFFPRSSGAPTSSLRRRA
jgi:hypothetical protein